MLVTFLPVLVLPRDCFLLINRYPWLVPMNPPPLPTNPNRLEQSPPPHPTPNETKNMRRKRSCGFPITRVSDNEVFPCPRYLRPVGQLPELPSLVCPVGAWFFTGSFVLGFVGDPTCTDFRPSASGSPIPHPLGRFLRIGFPWG